ADAEAVLRPVGWMIRARSRGQWEAVRALRHDPGATQVQLAVRLGVTQQTVSRAVKTSGWREESAAHPLAVRLLSMIDLTSAAELRAGEGAQSSRAVSLLRHDDNRGDPWRRRTI